MSVDWWNSVFQVGSLVLVLLTFACGAGALWTSRLINERQTTRVLTLETELTKAKTALSEQQERTTDAQLRLAEVHRAMLPRRIAMGGRQDDGSVRQARLAEVAKHAGMIALIHVVADPEAEILAGDIQNALLTSGWKAARYREPLSGRPRELLMIRGGVTLLTLEHWPFSDDLSTQVEVLPSDPRWSNAARAAQSVVELLRLDLEASGVVRTSGVRWEPEYKEGVFKHQTGIEVPDGVVVILVGLRPVEMQLTPLAWGLKKK